MTHIHSGLPDYLAPGLSILFVGINPGLRSSEVGHHYAGHSNRFWKLIFDAGLIPHQMTWQDDWRLLEYGYGFTNLIARPSSNMRDLKKQDFLRGRQTLVAKIKKYQPAIIAVLGISVARVLFPLMAASAPHPQLLGRPISTGLLPGHLADAHVFVLPNPSGRNAHYSYQDMKNLFSQLKAYLFQLPPSVLH